MNPINKGMTKKERNEALYQLRLQVVEMLERGMRNKEIAATLDMSVSYVSKIKCDYQSNGLAALQIYEHGKPWGEETRVIAPEDVKFDWF